MKRRHDSKEENLLAKWKKLWEQFIGERSTPQFPWPISRKKHPLDCGNSNCGGCHRDKKFGHKETKQEKLARKKQEEGETEL